MFGQEQQFFVLWKQKHLYIYNVLNFNTELAYYFFLGQNSSSDRPFIYRLDPTCAIAITNLSTTT